MTRFATIPVIATVLMLGGCQFNGNFDLTGLNLPLSKDGDELICKNDTGVVICNENPSLVPDDDNVPDPVPEPEPELGPVVFTFEKGDFIFEERDGFEIFEYDWLTFGDNLTNYGSKQSPEYIKGRVNVRNDLKLQNGKLAIHYSDNYINAESEELMPNIFIIAAGGHKFTGQLPSGSFTYGGEGKSKNLARRLDNDAVTTGSMNATFDFATGIGYLEGETSGENGVKFEGAVTIDDVSKGTFTRAAGVSRNQRFRVWAKEDFDSYSEDAPWGNLHGAFHGNGASGILGMYYNSNFIREESENKEVIGVFIAEVNQTDSGE